MDYVYPHEQAQGPAKPENPFLSIHLPLTFLSLGLALFFLGQSKAVKQQEREAMQEKEGHPWAFDNLKWRKETGEKQLKAMQEAKETLEKTVEKNKPLVAQSAATQAQFTSMMTELDQLAKAGDKDADIIIKGYGIKVNEGVAAPAPAEKPGNPAGLLAEPPKPN